MAKIVECFSIKPITRITLYINEIVDEVDENDVIVQKISVDTQNQISVSSQRYNNFNDILKDMSHLKLKYIREKGYLFLVTDEKTLFGCQFVPEIKLGNYSILSKIKVEDNFVYGQHEDSYNEEIFKKIDVVYKKVEMEVENDITLKPLQDTINGIKRSYKNTGIILKDDLKWLNKMYSQLNKEKRDGN